MDGPERSTSRWLSRAARRLAGWGLIALLALGAGCSSGKRARGRLTPVPPARTATAPAAAPVPTPTPTPTPRPSTLVVIEPGQAEGESAPDLVAASRAERERKRLAPPAAVVITDANLKEFAKDAKLTVAAPEATAPPTPPAAETAANPAGWPAQPNDESGWRKRGLALRIAWRDQANELTAMRLRAADLRQRFYAADDPYRRDGEIKPAWDRALSRIAELEASIPEAARAIEDFLEEGRRAGVPSGWLREGSDLEPLPEPPQPKPGEARDPVVVREPPR